MSTSRNQIRRTGVDNSPPVDLLPGELSIEMGTPTRLWVGVPTANDPTKKKLLVDPKHHHTIADVDNLQTTLDGLLAGTTHTHTMAAITDLAPKLTAMEAATAAKAPLVHTHPISEVTNLQITLDGKASKFHAHAIADVAGLQKVIDDLKTTGGSGGGLSPHSHDMYEVNGLENALLTKADKVHTHDWSDLTGTPPLATHTHAIADVVGLPLTLNSKSDIGHVHPVAEISGLGALAKLNQVGTAEIAANAVNGTKIAFGSDALGDIAYHDGAKWARLPAGSDGQYLQTHGILQPPTWVTPANAGGMTLLGAYTLTSAVVDVPIVGGPFSGFMIWLGITVTTSPGQSATSRALDLILGSSGVLSAKHRLGVTSGTASFQIYVAGTALNGAEKVIYNLSDTKLESLKEATVKGVIDQLQFTTSDVTRFKMNALLFGVR